MSLVLLAAAAVCVRAQYAMFAAGPGFEIEHVLAMRIESPTDGWVFRRRLDQRLRAIPEWYRSATHSLCHLNGRTRRRQNLGSNHRHWAAGFNKFRVAEFF